MLNCRPTSLDDIVGLEHIKETIKYNIGGAKLRNASYPHLIISSPPGLGKTTIASIIARIIEGDIHTRIGSEIQNEDDVYQLAATVKNNDVVFVEEAHSMGRKAMVLLLPWLEQGILYGYSGGDQAPRCVFLFPTTDAGKLSGPLRQRCKNIHIDYYSDEEIITIIKRAAVLNNCELNDDEALHILAKSSRGTPRIALEDRLVPVMNIMKVDNEPFSTSIVEKMFRINSVNQFGLDRQDIIYCQTLQKIGLRTNAPVSLAVLTNSTGLASNVLLNVIEPFLLRAGIITVGSRGRSLTQFGHNLFESGEEIIVDKETIMESETNAAAVVNEANLPFTLEDLKAGVESGRFKSVKQICGEYNLAYNKFNPTIKSLLANLGYSTRRRAGIVRNG